MGGSSSKQPCICPKCKEDFRGRAVGATPASAALNQLTPAQRADVAAAQAEYDEEYSGDYDDGGYKPEGGRRRRPGRSRRSRRSKKSAKSAKKLKKTSKRRL